MRLLATLFLSCFLVPSTANAASNFLLVIFVSSISCPPGHVKLVGAGTANQKCSEGGDTIAKAAAMQELWNTFDNFRASCSGEPSLSYDDLISDGSAHNGLTGTTCDAVQVGCAYCSVASHDLGVNEDVAIPMPMESDAEE